jgi:rubrerythrin
MLEASEHNGKKRASRPIPILDSYDAGCYVCVFCGVITESLPPNTCPACEYFDSYVNVWPAIASGIGKSIPDPRFAEIATE